MYVHVGGINLVNASSDIFVLCMHVRMLVKMC